ncbi:MAG: hypothetical protein E7314_04885 [Clostridiales bacterium]|nr:hypothetical protein [Clostridiales bacterium]
MKIYRYGGYQPVSEDKIIEQQLWNVRQAIAECNRERSPSVIREEDNPHPITIEECKLSESQKLMRDFMSRF